MGINKTLKKNKKLKKLYQIPKIRKNTIIAGKRQKKTHKIGKLLTQKGGGVFGYLYDLIDIKLFKRLGNWVNQHQFNEFISMYNEILEKVENQLANAKSNAKTFEDKALKAAKISTDILTNHRINKIFNLRKINAPTDLTKFKSKAIDGQIRDTETKQKSLENQLKQIGEILNKYKITFQKNFKRFDKTNKELIKVDKYFLKNIDNLNTKVQELHQSYVEFKALKPSQRDSQQRRVVMEYETYINLYKKVVDFQTEGKLNKLSLLKNDFREFITRMEFFFTQYDDIIGKGMKKEDKLKEWDQEVDNFWIRLQGSEEVIELMKSKLEELKSIIDQNRDLIATEGKTGDVEKYKRIDNKLEDCINMFKMLKEQIIGFKIRFFQIMPAIYLSFDMNQISTLINTARSILLSIANELNVSTTQIFKLSQKGGETLFHHLNKKTLKNNPNFQYSLSKKVLKGGKSKYHMKGGAVWQQINEPNAWQSVNDPQYQGKLHFYDSKAGIDFLYDPKNNKVFYLRQGDPTNEIFIGNAVSLKMENISDIPQIIYEPDPTDTNRPPRISVQKSTSPITDLQDIYKHLPTEYVAPVSAILPNATLISPTALAQQSTLVDLSSLIKSFETLLKKNIRINKDSKENQKYLAALARMLRYPDLFMLSQCNPQNNPVPILPMLFMLLYLHTEKSGIPTSHTMQNGNLLNQILLNNWIAVQDFGNNDPDGPAADSLAQLSTINSVNNIPFLNNNINNLGNLASTLGLGGNITIPIPNGGISTLFGFLSGNSAQNFIVTSEGTGGKLSRVDSSISTIKAREYDKNLDSIIKILQEILGYNGINAVEDHFINITTSLFKLRNIEKKIQKIEVEKPEPINIKYSWFVEDFEVELKEAKSKLPKDEEIEALIVKYKPTVDSMTKLSEQDKQIMENIIQDCKRIPNIFNIKDEFVPLLNYKPYDTSKGEEKPSNYTYPGLPSAVVEVYQNFLLGRMASNPDIAQVFNRRFKETLQTAVDKELKMMCGFYSFVKDRLTNIIAFGEKEILDICSSKMATYQRTSQKRKQKGDSRTILYRRR